MEQLLSVRICVCFVVNKEHINGRMKTIYLPCIFSYCLIFERFGSMCFPSYPNPPLFISEKQGWHNLKMILVTKMTNIF